LAAKGGRTGGAVIRDIRISSPGSRDPAMPPSSEPPDRVSRPIASWWRELGRSPVPATDPLQVSRLVVYLLVGGAMVSPFGSEYERHSLDVLRLIMPSAVPDAVNNLYGAAR
jgi:hypothetical protein